MSFPEIDVNYFDGGKNITSGNKDGNHTLAELFGKFKTGYTTHAGAEDQVVTFPTPFADANYSISLGGETNTVPEWKSATQTANGFTITSAAAGRVYWTVIHD